MEKIVQGQFYGGLWLREFHGEGPWFMDSFMEKALGSGATSQRLAETSNTVISQPKTTFGGK